MQNEPSNSRNTVIRTQNLSKRYGSFQALKNVNLDVYEGETFGFLGPNGAGKTTTIRSILGFQTPSSGKAHLFGNEVREGKTLRNLKKKIGYLPSELQLDEVLTGRAHIDFHRKLKDDSISQKLINYFDVPLDKRFKDLSSGNKQKLGIVLAFMHDPELVILDEPTSGLDPLLQRKLIDFLKYERGQEKTIFLSSHRLPIVKKICDRVGILRQGELVQVEQISSLMQKTGKEVRILAQHQINPENLDIQGVSNIDVKGNSAYFVFTGNQNQLMRLLDRLDLADVEIAEAPLEKIFMKYYEDRENV